MCDVNASPDLGQHNILAAEYLHSLIDREETKGSTEYRTVLQGVQVSRIIVIEEESLGDEDCSPMAKRVHGETVVEESTDHE